MLKRDASAGDLNGGVRLFLFVAAGIFVGQLFGYLGVSGPFFVVTILVLVIGLANAAFVRTASENFAFLFLMASSSLMTAFAGRELKEMILIPLAAWIMVRFRLFGRLGELPLGFLLYAILGLQIFVRGLTWPDYSSVDSNQMTGMLARAWIAGSIGSFLIGFFLFEHVNRRSVFRLIFGFHLAVVVVGTVMVVFGLQEIPLFNTFAWRWHTEIGRFGVLSTSGVVALLALLSDHSMVSRRSARLFLFVLCSWAVLAGGGRASLFGAVVAVSVYLVLVRRSPSKWLLAFGGSALAGFLLVQTVGVTSHGGLPIQRLLDLGDVSSFQEVFSGEFSKTDPEVQSVSEAAGSTTFRLYIWSHAYERMLENPVWGRGLEEPSDNFVDRQTGMFSQDAALGAGNAHNTYLSIASVWGIPAVVLFVVLFMGGIATSFRVMRANGEPFFVFCFLFMVESFLESFTADVYIMYPFMMLLGCLWRSRTGLAR